MAFPSKAAPKSAKAAPGTSTRAAGGLETLVDPDWPGMPQQVVPWHISPSATAFLQDGGLDAGEALEEKLVVTASDKNNKVVGPNLEPPTKAATTDQPRRRQKKTAILSEAVITLKTEDMQVEETGAIAGRPRRATAQMAILRLKGDRGAAPPDLFASKAVSSSAAAAVAALSDQPDKVAGLKGASRASIKEGRGSGHAVEAEGAKAQHSTDPGVHQRPIKATKEFSSLVTDKDRKLDKVRHRVSVVLLSPSLPTQILFDS